MPCRGLEPTSVLRLAFQSNALPAELLLTLCARPEMSLESAKSVEVLDRRSILDETINPFKFNVALRPETTRTTRDGEPRTATSTFTQLLGSDVYLVQIQCCFTSRDTESPGRPPPLSHSS